MNTTILGAAIDRALETGARLELHPIMTGRGAMSDTVKHVAPCTSCSAPQDAACHPSCETNRYG